MYIVDSFLTKCFGKCCYSITDIHSVEEIPNDLHFCTYKTSELEHISLLAQYGFYLIDINLQFEFIPDTIDHLTSDHARVEHASKSDLETLVTLARSSMINSRFSRDKNISEDVVDQIYRHWLSNYFTGNRGDFLYVTRIAAKAVSFMLIIENDDSFVIDLIATEVSARKMGHASRLINELIERACKERKRILVGTQSDNINAVNFYLRHGFKYKQNSLVFHMSN